jgi:hypothetical protein
MVSMYGHRQISVLSDVYFIHTAFEKFTLGSGQYDPHTQIFYSL